MSRRSGTLGDTIITTFNLENLFDLESDPQKDDETSTPSPSELETKLDKLVLTINGELLHPDILVAQEVENAAILQELGDRVNRENGTSYVATSLGSSDRRGIEVGFLWDSAQSRRSISRAGVDARATLRLVIWSRLSERSWKVAPPRSRKGRGAG